MTLEVQVRIVIDKHDAGYGWRLVRRTSDGADVLARGRQVYPDEHGCHAAVAHLAQAGAEAILVVQQPDGHWRWTLAGPDGEPLADSPALFRDAPTCGRAISALRRELAAAGAALATAA